MSAQNSSSDDDWAHYRDAAERLASRIAAPHADESRAAVHERARRRLAHLAAFLGELDHPERRVRVVHVTGTSGKGSTAAGISALLTAAGMKTGLATSPYLQVATEKLQIDGRLIAGTALRSLLADVEAAERRKLTRDPATSPLTYGELWPALALRWFDRERVDAAVIEVGAGGRLDPTNVVHPVASVITGVGFDHVATLGPTLADIAWHKAGIIKPGAPVVVGLLPADAWPAVLHEAAAAGVAVVRAPEPPLGDERTGTAPFVAANRGLALATVEVLAETGLLGRQRIDPAALELARLPGRLEAMPRPPGAPPVVLDGAHNPQKLAALLLALARRRAPGASRPVVVFGALAGKATRDMLALLAPQAAVLVTTAAAVRGKPASDATELAAHSRAAGFSGPVLAIPDPDEALAEAIRIAAREGSWVLVTGSMFLLGAVRERWFPAEDIVRQRTPWPIPAGVHPDHAPTGADFASFPLEQRADPA